MKKVVLLIAILTVCFTLASCSSKSASDNASSDAKGKGATADADKETHAILETSLGKIEVKLFADKAPKTVKNFIDLATGDQEWVDPNSLQKQNKPLYDGTIFHRVIPGFMIQGGDPKGNGTGGPGYRFEDEFEAGLLFDRPGLLAMANAGPNTNGSQFFITEAPTPHLNNRHTIFGEVVKGMDVVHQIANVPRDTRDKPKEDVVLKKVRIVKR